MEHMPDGVDIFDLTHAEGAPGWVKIHLGTLPQNAMASASFAQSRTGFAIRVPRDVTAGPLHLEFADSGTCRALIVLEQGAALTLCEGQKTNGFSNIGVEIIVGANAQLTHVRFAPGAKSVQVEEYAIRVARDGVYRAHLFNGGA